MRLLRAIAIAALSSLAATITTGQTPVPPPVTAVGDGRLSVSAAAGAGVLPIYTSQSWTQPVPGVRRAVIIVHGYQRNAADYFRNIAALAPDGSTLVVAPQFLAGEDVTAHSLPDSVLRWRRDHWSDGSDAEAPAGISSFEALDALLFNLADRSRLPDLRTVVLAGFSAGGQLVQRYAVVGQGADKLIEEGIGLRFVVGSPSSYLYLNPDRPLPDGGFGRFSGAANCPSYNSWKYGMAGALPRYVQSVSRDGAAALERRYVARDIVYFVGAEDNDTNHRFLDKSCAAEAQGPTRLARAQSFFAELKLRDDALKQRLHVIAGAAHNSARVLGSPCGRAALFDRGGCPDD